MINVLHVALFQVWNSVDPSRTSEYASAIPRLMMNSNLACFTTACIASMLKYVSKKLIGCIKTPTQDECMSQYKTIGIFFSINVAFNSH